MYLWLIYIKTGMKTGHAIHPSWVDKPAKCHICPQLPLMHRHKRHIELPWKGPAMFVKYQLGLRPAWALFQELECEGEVFKCVKNIKQNEEKRECELERKEKIKKSTIHDCKKKKSRRLSLASYCSLEVPRNIKTQSTVSYPSKCAIISFLTYHSL